jgi:uncharacterized protein (DUF2252 family)
MSQVAERSHLTPGQRADLGREARASHPPARQAELVLPADRHSPVALLEQQAVTRLAELLPLRHARMMVSPFTYFRGAALAMALDLAASPTSGLPVQLCGDAHLSNFGVFASQERRLLFDLNDFDETHPGPWEWDLKRLAASLAVAGRDNGFPAEKRRKILLAACRRYRDAMHGFARSRTLDIWYSRVEVAELEGMLEEQISAKQRKRLDSEITKARASDSLKAFAKLAESVDGRMRIRSDPPLVVPVADLLPEVDHAQLLAWLRLLLVEYRTSLSSERRVLLDRFEFLDMARKAVGVGSVGTRCWILLLRGRDDDDPLFLQVKEAQESVLAAVVPASMTPQPGIDNQGERVVTGQRLMQASSDIFLGWQRVVGLDGQRRDFYFRQLRDMKGSADIQRMPARSMRMYGELCAWTLARAHARSGDPIAIAAYLGDDDSVPEAVADFSEQYADLTERDHAELVAAVRSGRLEASDAV